MVSSQNTAPIRLYNIQALRGVAALLVLASHILIIDRKYSGDPVMPDALGFGLVGVDLFFVISGFIMVYITASARDAAPAKISEFLFARIARIYPIYWVISAALLAIYLTRPELVFTATELPPNVLKSFLLFPDAQYPLLEVGWTLIHEMGFYVLFAVLLFLPHRLRLLGLLIWAGLIVAGRLLDLEQLGPLSAVLLHPLSFEFIAGGLAAYLYLSGRVKWGGAFIGAALMWFALSIFMIDNFALTFYHNWARVAIYTVPACLLILGLTTMEKSGRRLPKWSITLGDWSYSLYLTHILTLSVIGRIWAKFARPGAVDNIVMAVLMVITAISVAGLTYILIEKPVIGAAKALRQKWFTPPPPPHPPEVTNGE